jgi:hypothetical protein
MGRSRATLRLTIDFQCSAMKAKFKSLATNGMGVRVADQGILKYLTLDHRATTPT